VVEYVDSEVRVTVVGTIASVETLAQASNHRKRRYHLLIQPIFLLIYRMYTAVAADMG
jgi:hypothetical protein